MSVPEPARQQGETSGLSFSIGEVAAMLGISAHTLRAWERRHLTLTPMRTPSGQRRYTMEDVDVLRQVKYERHVHGLSLRMATLVTQGVVWPDRRGERSQPGRHAQEQDTEPFRMLANLVAELVIVIDDRGRILQVNTALLRFANLFLHQIQGRSFSDFVDPFDRAKAVEIYRPPLILRRRWEIGLQGAHGRVLYSFDCSPLRGPQGARMMLVGREMPLASEDGRLEAEA